MEKKARSSYFSSQFTQFLEIGKLLWYAVKLPLFFLHRVLKDIYSWVNLSKINNSYCFNQGYFKATLAFSPMWVPGNEDYSGYQ